MLAAAASAMFLSACGPTEDLQDDVQPV